MTLHSKELIEEAKPYIDYKKDPKTKIAYLTLGGRRTSTR